MDILFRKNKHKVGYVFNKELLLLTNKLPQIKGRAILAHQLIAAYGLLKASYYIKVTPASKDELRKFHTSDYIEFIQKIPQSDIDEYIVDKDCEVFGLSYDCPPVVELYKTISYLASSSIAAAKAIINKQCHMAINWFGGWHHGLKDEASGFCYTNDIVYAILTFLENGYTKILYVDLDLHHGNGVQDAFAHTDKVVTLSLHKYELGFFPGTGDITDIGEGNKGKYHSINMPLNDGVDDSQYISIFKNIITRLIPHYKPQVIICQCGADGLSGDRMNCFNLTEKSYQYCVELLMSFSIPILFTGGGGYNFVNTAKLWALLTSTILGTKLDPNIPDHSLFLYYGPSYELNINASMRPNLNDPLITEQNLRLIYENIDKMSK